MRFLVVANDLHFNRLPYEIKAPKMRQANRDDGAHYQHNLFDITTEDDLNQFENSVATYLDAQARLFFWYRNRARKDYYVQGWKPRRIYADFIVTLKGDEPGDDDFHKVFVVETKGVHLSGSEDSEYKRTVFDICSKHAGETDWAEFVPTMQTKVLRFVVVDEDERQARLNGMLFSDEERGVLYGNMKDRTPARVHLLSANCRRRSKEAMSGARVDPCLFSASFFAAGVGFPFAIERVVA